MPRPPRAARRPGAADSSREPLGDVERLRRGSRRLTRLNEGFAASLDRLVGATVRLYRHNGRLKDAESRLRDCGKALSAEAERARAAEKARTKR